MRRDEKSISLNLRIEDIIFEIHLKGYWLKDIIFLHKLLTPLSILFEYHQAALEQYFLILGILNLPLADCRHIMALPDL